MNRLPGGVWMGPHLGGPVCGGGWHPIDQHCPGWLCAQCCPVESQEKSEIWIFRQSFSSFSTVGNYLAL